MVNTYVEIGVNPKQKRTKMQYCKVDLLYFCSNHNLSVNRPSAQILGLYFLLVDIYQVFFFQIIPSTEAIDFIRLYRA